MRLRPVIAFALTTALLLPAPVPAQAPAAGVQAPSGQAGTLKIVVLDGEGAKNNVRAKSGTAPAVAIHDESDKPVAGAEVVFQLPAVGPGGVFHGWMRTQTVRSDAEGKAVSTGYTPNEEEGRFNIKVTATSGTRTGTAVIAQSNVRGAGASADAPKRGWWKVAAIIGGAVIVGGVVAATRGDDEEAAVAKVPVTITPGPVSVGGPR